MLRGALAASLVLVVLYTISQKGASSRIGEAGGVFTTGLKRLFDPTVAGIGNHAKTGVVDPPASTGSTTGPYMQPVAPSAPPATVYNV